MKKIATIIFVLLFTIPISAFVMSISKDTTVAEEKAEEYFQTAGNNKAAHTKEDGTTYNICYVDIDPYPPSGEMLYYLLQEINDMGWMNIEHFDKLPFDPQDTDAGALIDYLAQQGTGDYISFSKKYNYYIALDNPQTVKKEIEEGIKEGEIDLILCLGTSPGKLIIQEMGIEDVPVMVYYSVDPVSAGLSQKQEYSGQDNVWCHTSSQVYKNQLSFYHDAYSFQKLGMVYYDESIAARDIYGETAKALGVEIAEQKIETISGQNSEEEYYNNLKNAYKQLVEEEHIDAFLLNTDMIKDSERMDELLSVFIKADIPVFVQNGQTFVKNGALMLMAASDAVSQAPFAADAFARILSGESPGDIYQKFVPSPYVSINLDTANQIGYEVPDDIILLSEQIYGGSGERE
ncbi:ABC transporter substrate binding protein [Eubacterium oxidoreducens]|uniref:ABC-type uncharacterized transport system, substrate-binding protein n=1 Tax=Eubacterium oxidoreducens TaxID=1732 RepID=A0A1G6AAR9_EUBOX|nr:ABC transporter substrate binding protein [Eubacterium oxidoreducens]SDB05400.1 ABC-type uncharacterized transport system, substrate-binding protein [Eubacterium oxidoreducens]